MSESLITKLVESFDELERCIEVTKRVLGSKEEVPSEVLARVEQYSSVVLKQRQLAKELQVHIQDQNWEEVGRHVRLINGLSGMIRDDAQAILKGTVEPSPESAEEQLLC